MVTVEAKTAAVSEGDSAVFMLTRTGNTRDPLTIRLQYLGGGTNTTHAAYFAEYETITEVFLDTWEDSVVNYPPVRDFTVELFGDGEYGSGTDEVWTAGDPATATVTATDNDELVLITVEAEARAVEAEDRFGFDEFSIWLPFVFRRTGDVSEPLSFYALRYHNTDSISDHNTFPDEFLNHWRFPHTFPAGQAELRIEWDVPGNVVRGGTYLLLGDGQWWGFHRIWKAGVPPRPPFTATLPTPVRPSY